MKELKYIIAGHYHNVVGWRLHNHKREAKNMAAAKSIMKEDEIFNKVHSEKCSK